MHAHSYGTILTQLLTYGHISPSLFCTAQFKSRDKPHTSSCVIKLHLTSAVCCKDLLQYLELTIHMSKDTLHRV